jgi:hypothetical protein
MPSGIVLSRVHYFGSNTIVNVRRRLSVQGYDLTEDAPMRMIMRWVRLTTIVLVFGASQAKAIVISFDESGNGTVEQTSTGRIDPLASLGVINDAVTGQSTLAYQLGGSHFFFGATPTPGFIRVTESTSSTLSDVIHIDETGVMFIYSLKDGSDLADTGLPTIPNGANVVTLPETGSGAGAGLFNYTPTDSQPGGGVGVNDDGLSVYNFSSPEPAVATPEPSSLALGALGGLGAFGYAVRRSRKRAA